MLNYCQENWFVKSRVGSFFVGCARLAFLSSLLRRHCNNMKRTHTHTKHWPKQTTDESGRSQRWLQHGQFPDKNCRDISRGIWNFCRFWKLSFIYSKISRGTPNHVVRSPGRRTPKSNTKIDNARVARTQNSTQTYLCKYTHTHQWKHTYACRNTTYIYGWTSVAGKGECCSRPPTAES